MEGRIENKLSINFYILFELVLKRFFAFSKIFFTFKNVTLSSTVPQKNIDLRENFGNIFFIRRRKCRNILL
ncbi:MAG: hypothetical protein XD76_0531 [candidate division TA06 bacterium 32_111]|uniref:Uncharacterized protein n=2 Tax=Bacteria candidate phyla TaxID=1783234 RepID=A0A101I297_UNCT6|nr:MAG: hypothetical protein XD76_0531 [candidate division TA06 bacterium 32_111]KUK87423.1 MAG: hypothetical protein XE03_0821 [candidate division TA06 bacterium 34_109]HAF07743.1 hypothetical protein [candidate division WOR-3 bacterium]HCP17261.1 hypothetical protein [candidate division WOR-3 bacterium]